MKTIIFLIYLLFIVCFAEVKSKKTYPVIIVGAGVSGLRASQILSENHIHHLIIQSTHNIGGRVAHMKFAGLQVDKGASFLHNATESNPINKLVQKFKWPWANGNCSYKVMYYEGEKKDSIPWRAIEQARKMYFSMSRDILNKYDETEQISVEKAYEYQSSRLKYHSQPVLRKVLVRWMFDIIGNIDGTSISKVSATNEAYNETKPDLFLLPTYHTLITKIFSNPFNIAFGETVTSIHYSGELIEVTTNKGQYLAKKVICSVPLGVLKAKKIRFLPELPEGHQQAIKKIGFGIQNKLFVRFSKPFWKEGDRWLSFVTRSRDNKYPSAFVAPYPHYYILIFFVSGNYSLEISGWSDEHLKNDLHTFLCKFKEESSIQIIEVKQTKWHEDPSFKGTYSFYQLGTRQSHFISLAAGINDKLWLTGEHTSKQLNAYVHGAYLSGERTALEVLKKLNNTGST